MEDFVVTNVRGEQLFKTPIKDDSYRVGVKYITISWNPNSTDIGNHIICVRAVDNTG